MNIFIDTSILFTDPFFNEIFKKEILTACRLKKIKIFISEVVLKELKFNYEKSLDKIIIDIRNINTNSEKIIPDFEKLSILDKEATLEKLDSFYHELSKIQNFEVLPVFNDFLPIVLDKAIKRDKPFSEKKTELKDALIWLTYIKHINDNKLEENYLLTQNVNDFGLKKTDQTFIIHPELQKECKEIILVNSFKEIHKIYKNYIDQQEEKTKQKFFTWIKNENIDENYVYDILSENYVDKISDNISNYIDKIDLDTYFEDSHLISMGGYTEVEDLSWGSCTQIEVEILEENAIISGVLQISAEIHGYGYNSARDPGDENFSFLGSNDINFKIHFNFLINEDDIDNFEITDIENI